MDQNRDNIWGSDCPFSFQQLLYGDDWHQWDTFPTINASANLPDPTFELNHYGLAIEPDPRLLTLTREPETMEQWLHSQINERFEIAPPEEDIQEVEMSSAEENFIYQELLGFVIEQIRDVFTGLTAEIIDENLTRRNYKDRSGQPEKCVICLDEFGYNDEASKLACGHDFHFGCIKNWLMVKNICPLCKEKVI